MVWLDFNLCLDWNVIEVHKRRNPMTVSDTTQNDTIKIPVETIKPKTFPHPVDDTIQTLVTRHLPIASLAQEPYPDIGYVVTVLRKTFSKELSYASNEQILFAIKTILCNERHQRFIHHKELIFDEDTTQALSNLTHYTDKESIEEISSETPPSGICELITITCDEMAAMYLRKRVTKKKYTQNKNLILYTQTHGHINNEGRLIPHQTLSSELQKRDYSAYRSFNSNLAKITLQQDDGKENLLLIRSGRSDNPSRLLKLLQFNFLSSWYSDNKPGITMTDKDGPIFQLSLFTAQDPHPLRNLIKGFKKTVPMDERTSIIMIKKSIDEIWPHGTIRDIQVQLYDGSTMTFLAEKPLLKNFILSKTALDPQNIIDSRKWSEETTLREFDLLRKTDVAMNSPKFSKFFENFSLTLLPDQPPNKGEVITFLQKIKEPLSSKISTDHSLEVKLYMALESIAISLTNHNIEGEEFLSEISPGLELYYHYYLSELINTSISVQCKAGCDRALIMTSMRLAQVQLEQAYETIYDLPKDEGVLQEFEDEFISFCGKFGPSILEVCRGNHWMKGIDKPILRKILNDKITENSIQGMKLVKGT
jgi:hypothetical protein